MAAPCFFTPESLAADLAALGFGNAREPDAVSHTGRMRLETLAWLARVIDPEFDADTEEALANFWDSFGLHSTSRKGDGHRFPVTASGERQKDRHAAGLYMRTAIDLAMAFRRRREKKPALETENVQTDDGENETAPILTEEDNAANSQLERLIKDRHILFPSTVRLFEKPPTKKRRPFTQRKGVQDNRSSSTISSQSKLKSPKLLKQESEGMLNTREEVLERLRAIQRDTQDALKTADSSATGNVVDGDGDDETELSETALRSFAASCNALANLVKEFNVVSEPALAARAQQPDLAQRDIIAESKISSSAVECDAIEKEVDNLLSQIKRMRNAVSKLEHGRRVLESLPNSFAIRQVVAQKRRLEGQMI